MRNTCSGINGSIQTKADLFKSLPPAREEERFDCPPSVWGGGKGCSHLELLLLVGLFTAESEFDPFRHILYHFENPI